MTSSATGPTVSVPTDTAVSAPRRVCRQELASHRAYLLRFAQRRLRDPMLAEDAVHDVFEAVLSGRATFAGRSAVRSWLTGVLKHKIVDAVRREVRFESLDGEDGAGDDGPQAFASAEPGPDEVAEQRQRLARTLERLDTLPSSLREVMQRRFLDDEPTETVCRALGLTETNLFVRIHRARRQLAV